MCESVRAIPHKERLATLHAICLQISRHISQKCSWIHPVFTPLFVSSDEKFYDASVAQSLCGIAIEHFALTLTIWWFYFNKNHGFCQGYACNYRIFPTVWICTILIAQDSVSFSFRQKSVSSSEGTAILLHTGLQPEQKCGILRKAMPHKAYKGNTE